MSWHKRDASPCPTCGSPRVYISLKNPFVDDGGYECTNRRVDANGNDVCLEEHDISGRLNASSRASARAEYERDHEIPVPEGDC